MIENKHCNKGANPYVGAIARETHLSKAHVSQVLSGTRQSRRLQAKIKRICAVKGYGLDLSKLGWL